MAHQKIDIEYTDSGAQHKVTLTVRSLPVLLEAAQKKNILEKKGEALVAALLDYKPGNISEIFRTKDGARHDGAGGEPQAAEYFPNGKPSRIEFYRDGRSIDGLNGEPSLRYFREDGKVTLLHHRDENGLNDTLRGDPALQEFDVNGNLVAATRYKNNQITQELSPSEAANYVFAEERDQLAKIQKAFGSKVSIRLPRH